MRTREQADDQESIESALACLGNARVYLELVSQRVELASRLGSGSLLVPALADLKKIHQLIVKTQKIVSNSKTGE
jgi:hypothetical protein